MKRFSIFLYSLAVLFCTTVIKFYINLKTTDGQNGFFLKDQAVTGLFLTALFLLLFLSVFLIAFFSDLKPGSLKPVPAFILSFLLSAAIVYDLFKENPSFYGVNRFYYVLLVISALLSAVYFVCFGVARLLNREIFKLLSALPVIFWIFRLITVFISYTTLASTLDHTLLLLSVCSALISVLIFAKREAGTKLKHPRISSAFILASSLFTVSYSLAGILLYASGHGEYIHSVNGFYPTLFFTGLFTSSFLF